MHFRPLCPENKQHQITAALTVVQMKPIALVSNLSSLVVEYVINWKPRLCTLRTPKTIVGIILGYTKFRAAIDPDTVLNVTFVFFLRAQ